MIAWGVAFLAAGIGLARCQWRLSDLLRTRKERD